ncbi:ABC transporter substrate-binding protein [Paenibacillus sp. PAMC21692]|uniref:ABC transporter substrate-binding protein n=1 Tax=Paenibacillus sp. PAMC21692 TaxID=2762320 RepID=UPI00164D3AFE|nr:ABC transporter substrate-binding protein [Paenibacillus sp. PAMC21692]QNK59438.1 ABC transporter substrate-binding protein [Paenibacillus sp. PAMC21692]
MKRKHGWLIMLLVLALLATACGGNNDGKESAAAPSGEPAKSSQHDDAESNQGEEAPAEAGTIEVTDDTETKLTFDGPVEKVACIVSLCIDLLAELGMEPAAIAESGVRVIASSPEFYGSKGESFPSIGGSFFEPSLEDLVTAAPELVIGLKGVHDTLREGLDGIAPLYLANPKSYKDSLEFLEKIGELTGRTDEAAAAKARFMEKLETAKEKSPMDKKALIIFGSDVNFSVVTATGLGGSVMKEFSNYPWQVEKAEDDPYGEGSVPYSLERLLVEDPDVIFVESYSYSPGTLPVSEQLAASPLWSKLKAVQNGQVHEVRSPIWGDGRGTRSLGILMDEALAILYPEIF